MDKRPDGGLTLAEAAVALGISSEAVRKRLKRGGLAGQQVDGRWYVTLDSPGGQPADAGTHRVDERPDDGGDAGYPPLVAALEARIGGLEAELARTHAALQRAQEAEGEQRRIIAGLMARLPELAAPARTPRSQDRTEVEPTENLSPRATGFDPPSVVAEVPAVPVPARRPWWRRWGP